MSEPQRAHLAFITNPSQREVLLNVQIEGQEIQRFQINRDQLFGLNAKSADILMKDFK